MKWSTTFFRTLFVIAVVGGVALGQTGNMVTNGGFESGEPSLWTAEPGTSAGVALSWATDQVQGGTHSLKIVKPNTGSMARWMSGNNVRYWVNDIPSGVDIKLGAYVKTEGVNTNPASDDEKWQVKFWFYDSSDALIGGGPFALDVDQSAATTDWYADTNGVGTVNLPVKAVKLLISAEAGASATGTAWFDTFIFVGRAGAWAGQNWNGFVDADQGWQYWFAPVGGNDGQTVFGASGVTDEQAHSGTYSLKMSADVGRADGEGLFFTETIPIPLNSTGKKYMLSVWMMTDSIIVDSVFNAESALGFTWTWHTKMFEDGGGWNEFTGADLRFKLTDETTGWTRYTAIMEVPRDDAAAVSIRSRAWHKWPGLSYWDDVEMLEVRSVITSVDEDDLLVDGTVPLDYALHQNYPNPFNPSTTITYDVPSAGLIGLEIYNGLGQKVRTLLNEVRTAGTWQAVWNGTDDGGNLVPSGIYFYRLNAAGKSATAKMVMMK